MDLVYLIIGILLPITILQIRKIVRSFIAKRKSKPIVKTDDIKQLRAELAELRNILSELRADMKHLQEVNDETQKHSELLFPQNFDKDKDEGKTVFVKNGEEKPYETVDWRSR
jgi:hypothetical protein